MADARWCESRGAGGGGVSSATEGAQGCHDGREQKHGMKMRTDTVGEKKEQNRAAALVKALAVRGWTRERERESVGLGFRVRV